jgi:hypothetical protein
MDLPSFRNRRLMLTQRRLGTFACVDAETLLLVSEYSREVAVLQWPAHEDERQTLDRLGLPRLLVLDLTADPPTSVSCLEDWTRLPVESADLRARLAMLAARSELHGAVPRLDALGLLWHRGTHARLSPTEERLAAALLAHFGEVVRDEDLLDAGWDRRPASAGALRIHLTRLRRRIRPLGLEIRSRRGVGHVLRDASVDVS